MDFITHRLSISLAPFSLVLTSLFFTFAFKMHFSSSVTSREREREKIVFPVRPNLSLKKHQCGWLTCNWEVASSIPSVDVSLSKTPHPEFS